jgi:predicted permease
VNLLQLLFPDFSLILCGWLLCRYTALNRSVWQPIEALVYYFLFPILLFGSIVRQPLDLGGASALIAAGVVLGLVGIALAYLLPHLPVIGRHIDRRDHAAGAQVAFRFNTFIGLALVERLAGPPGMQMLAILMGFCIPVLNTGAVWPMARQAGTHFGSAIMRNPLILATVAGLAANLVGLSLPHWLEPSVSRISGAAIVLGLMAAGAGLQLGSLAQNKTLAAALLAIKHLVLPVLALLIARVMALDAMQTTIFLCFSALPTASSAYVLAVRMGYNGPLIASLVTLSTLLAGLSIPFALGVLQPLAGP